MLIVGAGAAATDLLAMLALEPPETMVDLVFYDDISQPPVDAFFGRYPVLHSSEQAAEYFKTVDERFTVAVGEPAIRQRLAKRFQALGGRFASLISSHSQIGEFNEIADTGVLIMHSAILTNGIEVGEGSLINMRCTLGHGLHVGRYCELAPGTTVSGSVIGDFTLMGVGSLVLPRVPIGRNVTVGVGAVVTRPVEDNWVVAGNPARKIGENPPLDES